MAFANPIIHAFNAGELSPSMYGRVDLEKYYNGCKVLENFIPLPHGPAKRRGGTEFINEVLGKNRVVNGDFSSATGWTLGSGWSISSGIATATAGVESSLSRTSDCVAGREYLVTYTTSVSAGTIHARIGGTDLTPRSASGTYSERAVFGSTDSNVSLVKDVDFQGTVDDFSVMEVNPAAVLISFEFSTIQAYILEFTEKQVRFYMNGGIILDSGVPYTVTTPFLESELADLRVTQSADVLYIVHPNHHPQKLLRYGHANWELKEVTFLGQPVKSISGADKTNPVKVYCSHHGLSDGDPVSIWDVQGMTEINGEHYVTGCTEDSYKLRGVDGTSFSDYTGGGYSWKGPFYITNATQTNPVVITLANHGFVDGDRIRISGVNGMTELNDKNYTVSNRTKDTFELEGVDGTGYSAYTSGGKAGFWPELFEEDDHYPSTTEFFEERLFFAATNQKPQTVFGSVSGDYENMTEGPNDDDAILYTIAAKGVNPIVWLVPTKRLLIGTRGGEWVMSSSGGEDPITPSNVNVKRESTWGSENVQALLVNDAVLFVQRGGTKVREFVYSFEKDGYVAPDLTILADHITAGGIRRVAYQQEPFSYYYAIRADGVMLCLTYERLQNVVGWSRHVSTNGKFIDIATITSSGSDEVWVLVKRTIEGSPRLYIERFGSEYLDSYITWSGGGTVSITGITNAAQAVVTAPGSPCTNGEKVRILSCQGMTELNEGIFTVSDKTGDTFKLKNDDGTYVNSTSYGTYTGGGTVEVVAKTFSGLGHLAGETVYFLGDGCMLPSATVTSSGTVATTAYVGSLVAGLQLVSTLQPMNLEAGAQAGTAQGKVKRIHALTIRFKDTQACWVKTADNQWQEIPFRDDADPSDAPIPLFSGDKTISVFPGEFDTEGEISLRVSEPYPATIVALMPKLKTMDVL